VILTETALDAQLKINDFCHKNEIAFISADVRGLFCWAFCDFGSKFEVHDKNGEEPSEVMIEKITQVTTPPKSFWNYPNFWLFLPLPLLKGYGWSCYLPG